LRYANNNSIINKGIFIGAQNSDQKNKDSLAPPAGLFFYSQANEGTSPLRLKPHPWDIKTNRKGFSWFVGADGSEYIYGTAGMRWPYQTKDPS